MHIFARTKNKPHPSLQSTVKKLNIMSQKAVSIKSLKDVDVKDTYMLA
jgi:hypothetical protein